MPLSTTEGLHSSWVKSDLHPSWLDPSSYLSLTEEERQLTTDLLSTYQSLNINLEMLWSKLNSTVYSLLSQPISLIQLEALSRYRRTWRQIDLSVFSDLDLLNRLGVPGPPATGESTSSSPSPTSDPPPPPPSTTLSVSPSPSPVPPPT